MISTWSEWKRYPRPGRGENIEAPITPGIYEVRIAGTGALHSLRGGRQRRPGAGACCRSAPNPGSAAATASKLPDLEYRTCATSSKADAKAAARTHDRPPRNLYERRGLMAAFRGDAPGEPGTQIRWPSTSGMTTSKMLEAGLPLRPVHCGCFRPILRINTPENPEE